MKHVYLGIHRPGWLARPDFANVRVFVSRNVFYRDGAPAKTFPRRPQGLYAVDSGGFTELQRHGRWIYSQQEYVAFLRRLWRETGPFEFAAPRDRMCEPMVIHGGTFKGVRFAGTRQFIDPEHKLDDDALVLIHQRDTVDDLVQLRTLAPELPIAPVLQGWTIPQYVRCYHMYRAADIDLAAEPIVAVGSVCRRQGTEYAAELIATLHELGLHNLHGFGFQIEGLARCWDLFSTADTMSWSFDGRYAGPCQHPEHWRDPNRQPLTEGNCPTYALRWRQQHIADRPARAVWRQESLFV